MSCLQSVQAEKFGEVLAEAVGEKASPQWVLGLIPTDSLEISGRPYCGISLNNRGSSGPDSPFGHGTY